MNHITSPLFYLGLTRVAALPISPRKKKNKKFCQLREVGIEVSFLTSLDLYARHEFVHRQHISRLCGAGSC